MNEGCHAEIQNANAKEHNAACLCSTCIVDNTVKRRIVAINPTICRLSNKEHSPFSSLRAIFSQKRSASLPYPTDQAKRKNKQSMTTTRTTTTTTLTTDQIQRLQQAFEIMGNDWNWNDVVHLCFGQHDDDDVTLLPALEAYYETHAKEFAQYQQTAAAASQEETLFDAMLERLQQFQVKHGHQHVTESDDRALCWWIAWQKHLMSQYKLSVDHQMKLLKVNFDYRGNDNDDDDDDWENNMHGWDTRRAT